MKAKREYRPTESVALHNIERPRLLPLNTQNSFHFQPFNTKYGVRREFQARIKFFKSYELRTPCLRVSHELKKATS